ncbi:hypothetical protein TWF481_003383 [Arthrobotrys musiformis]|uniref:Uncharacterized protein n=1 Tax=Arthrobotrys musiformis TaxID=47236 RepID=A0AAV9VSA3_9PEZI
MEQDGSLRSFEGFEGREKREEGEKVWIELCGFGGWWYNSSKQQQQRVTGKRTKFAKLEEEAEPRRQERRKELSKCLRVDSIRREKKKKDVHAEETGEIVRFLAAGYLHLQTQRSWKLSSLVNKSNRGLKTSG